MENARQTDNGRSILLVEEDPGHRGRLYDLLRLHGCLVVAAPSSEQAVELLKHERPDLVLVSVQNGHRQGLECIERIRSLDSLIPIIVIEAAGSASLTPSSEQSVVQIALPDNSSDETIWSVIERHVTVRPHGRQERWPGTILVVEDEAKLRHVLEEFLTLRGFTVRAAASGDEALQICDRQVPTTVLLDIRMPGMDGLLTLKQLKSRHPAVTVVMITGVEEEQAMREASVFGAHDYIMKPFNLKYLETTLLSKLLVGTKS